MPPLVTVGDVQGVQVFQGPSVISEGHLGYPLQDLVELLLTLSLEKRAKTTTPVMYGGPYGDIWVCSSHQASVTDG